MGAASLPLKYLLPVAPIAISFCPNFPLRVLEWMISPPINAQKAKSSSRTTRCREPRRELSPQREKQRCSWRCNAQGAILKTITNPRRVRIARSSDLLPQPPRASVLQHNSVNRCFLDKRTECEPAHICGLGPRLS